MEPISLAAQHTIKRHRKNAHSETRRVLKPNAHQSLLWLLNWPQDSRVRCPQCHGRIPPQWIAYDTPPRDEWEAARRAISEPLCATCQSSGLVCPTCCGARYVISPDRALGSDSRIVYCADCSGIVSTPQGDKRVTWDDSEQRAIALWLQSHRETHPAIANPARIIEADPAWAAFQAEQERARLAKRRADAEASYAAYVQQWGDPRAAVLRGRSGRGKSGTPASISDKQVLEIIGEYAKVYRPQA